MNIKLDEQGTVERFKTLTMDQAGIGSDEPDELVVEHFGQVSLGDQADVDDVARLTASTRPFGLEWHVDYRFCTSACDERIDTVALLLQHANDSQKRFWLEVSLTALTRFEGGSVDAALLFLARAAVEDLEHPA